MHLSSIYADFSFFLLLFIDFSFESVAVFGLGFFVFVLGDFGASLAFNLVSLLLPAFGVTNDSLVTVFLPSFDLHVELLPVDTFNVVDVIFEEDNCFFGSFADFLFSDTFSFETSEDISSTFFAF